ncbi:Aste57867_15837 [Aphanomyces stellatus]|uniref:Aste57867_15837 protein n=1 Tax=Aphanomyces stellatus TaxID=120398 RepID=A0A485L508_9STRA|nr:hypothetical protein As57867_015781 [Aphanomyces stellatus]VFT92624.1 Aste57867_15837 [Aphanomyces stellatus]
MMMNLDTMMLEDKKQAEHRRQHKYRTAKKMEHQKLKSALRDLQEKIECLKATPRPQRQAALRRHQQQQNPYTMATQVLLKYNQSLRDQVESKRKLAELLYTWVASHHPEPSLLTARTSFMQATLSSNPLVRRHGLQWLNEKVYHAALEAFPRHPLGQRVDDAIVFNMHTCEDACGPTVAATEAHTQYTFFAPPKLVASVIWGSWLQNQMVQTNVAWSTQVLEHVDEHLVYYRGVNYGTGASTLAVVGMFEGTDGRVVITYCSVTDDESFPMQDGETWTHGFGWTILENVAESVTLARHSFLTLAPVSTKGVAPLEDIGKLYLQDRHAQVTNRDAYVARLRHETESMYSKSYAELDSVLSNVLDQLCQVSEV